MKKKISKHYGTRTCCYDDNPDRRVRCPEWTFTQGFLNSIQEGAEKNEVSKSYYFEKVVENFFILENPKLIRASKRDNNSLDKKKKAPRMTLHPQIIEDLTKFSEKSTPSTSKYIELLFTKYHHKYGYEIQLKNLIHYIA